MPVFRQELIVQYMLNKNPDEGYTTREIASMMDVTTNAILAAFKRLRKKGRVYYYQNKWWLSGSEKRAHAS